MAAMETKYPAQLSIDYPDRNLDRLTSFFRIFVAIPIVIILALLSGARGSSEEHRWTWQYASGGAVFIPIVLMLLFRQKYPRWWFDWNLALAKFAVRVDAYMALLSDRYPSTDEDQYVHIEIPYPDAMKLSRWLPLVKWFLAIPHYVVLFFLTIAGIVAIIIAWFAILFTGRYPREFFDFIVGIDLGIAGRGVCLPAGH